MRKIYAMILLVLLPLGLFAECEGYKFLGLKNSETNKSMRKDSIVWGYSDGLWKMSKPADILKFDSSVCKDKRGYILINNDDIHYNKTWHMKGSYQLKKGWNYMAAPKEGIDIIKTFRGVDNVDFVYVYDKRSKAWAGYSPQKYIMKMIERNRILSLKKIEPSKGFYVYSNRDILVKIERTQISKECKALMESDDYRYLVDSGMSSSEVYNKEKSMGFKSRYFSHHRKGLYDDSRIVFIYEKPKRELTKKMLAYGPAVPKSKFFYDKAYEETKIYMYDYLNEACYEGAVPSIRIPPYATLHKLK